MAMLQIFKSFKNPKEFLQEPYKNALQGEFNKENLLIFDDNLNAMQFLLQNAQKSYKNSVDLIYIDPPFATNNTDIWEFKDSQKVLYPTQKNRALLRQIIAMSSNENSLVMDCFCGSGGFLREALSLWRKFIGIDSSIEAIKINKEWIAKSACECGFIVISDELPLKISVM